MFQFLSPTRLRSLQKGLVIFCPPKTAQTPTGSTPGEFVPKLHIDGLFEDTVPQNPTGDYHLIFPMTVWGDLPFSFHFHTGRCLIFSVVPAGLLALHPRKRAAGCVHGAACARCHLCAWSKTSLKMQAAWKKERSSHRSLLVWYGLNMFELDVELLFQHRVTLRGIDWFALPQFLQLTTRSLIYIPDPCNRITRSRGLIVRQVVHISLCS